MSSTLTCTYLTNWLARSVRNRRRVRIQVLYKWREAIKLLSAVSPSHAAVSLFLLVVALFFRTNNVRTAMHSIRRAKGQQCHYREEYFWLSIIYGLYLFTQHGKVLVLKVAQLILFKVLRLLAAVCMGSSLELWIYCGVLRRWLIQSRKSPALV